MVSNDALSRASICSKIRRSSLTGFKQEPGKKEVITRKILGTQEKEQGGFKELTLQMLAS
jgi:hypothetical protein